MVEYVGSHSKIKIICPIHGEFNQKPTNHLSGFGCSVCGNNVRLTTENFIKKSNNIHGDKYDYSLVTYVNSSTKVKIICPIHGEFEQRPTGHLSGKECRKCGSNKTVNYTRMLKDDFIKLATIKHCNTYDYSSVEYVNCDKKVSIMCVKHGEFKQKPYLHLKGQGCPMCKTSKGELEVKRFLDERNIKNIPQYFFIDCKYKNVLRFDFYLPDYNTCIEYDGIQHFKPFKWDIGGEEFKKNKERDEIKNDYCLKNGIKLIRIKYTENVKDYLLRLVGTENKLIGSSHKIDK